MEKKKRRLKLPIYTDYLMIGLICLLLVAQIGFSYYFLNTQRRESYYRSYDRLIQELILSDENGVEILSRLAATISQDEDVAKWCYGQNLSENELTGMYARMRKYVAVSEPVRSVLLYSRTRDEILDVLRPFSKPSEDLSDNLRERLDGFSGLRQSFVINNSDVGRFNEDRLAYVYFFDSRSDMVLAFYADYVSWQSDYDNYQMDVSGQLIIADRDGNVVFGGGEFLPGDSIAENEVFTAREANVEGKLMDVGGVKSAVSYMYSDYCGRWYITVTPVKHIKSRAIFTGQNGFVVIGIVISLFVIVRWMIWLKRIHISARDLRTRGGQSVGQQEFDKTAHQLFDYMNSPELSGVKSLRDALPLGVNPSAPCACCIVKIDRFAEFRAQYSPMDVELYCYGMRNIFEELIGAHNVIPQYVNRDGDRMEYLLFNIQNESQFDDAFNETAQKCIKNFYEYIGVDASFFVSRVSGVEDIHLLHRQVEEIAKYGFYFGSGVVLDESVLREDDPEAMEAAGQYCNLIEESILGNQHEEREYYERLIEHMARLSVSQMHRCLVDLILKLHDVLATLRKSGAILTDFDTVQLLTELQKAEFISDVSSVVTRIFSDIENQRKAVSERRTDILVERCLEIIAAEYRDSTLCLEGIASRVGLSANYLGRKFRQVAGCSVADKITEYRLLEAERQIVSTDKSLKAIMIDVGFTNNSYFSVMFRKRYGVAPSAYRRNSKDRREL